MSYTKTNWTTTTPINPTNLNNMENGIEVGHNNAILFGETTMPTTNDYSVNVEPAPASYTNGMGISISVNTDSTGSTTLNVNGLGAKPILKSNGNAVSNLKNNGVYTLRYNSNANAGAGAFILQGEGGEGTAQDADVLNGKTYTNDQGVSTGTMANNGAVTITPGTTDQTVAKGYHDGTGVVYGDADLTATNIRDGITIFGVIGTLVEGKKYAKGSFTGSDSGVKITTGFQPRNLMIEIYNASFDNGYIGLFSEDLSSSSAAHSRTTMKNVRANIIGSDYDSTSDGNILNESTLKKILDYIQIHTDGFTITGHYSKTVYYIAFE